MLITDQFSASHFRAPISNLLNLFFISSQVSATPVLKFDIRGISYTLSISKVDILDIDYGTVFLTGTKAIKDQNSLSKDERLALDVAKSKEIDFLPKDAITPIPRAIVPDGVQIQPFKWALVIKTSSGNDAAKLHCPRILSNFFLSAMRYAVHGNMPNIILSTLRMLCSILPTCLNLLNKVKIIIFCRYLNNAFSKASRSSAWSFTRRQKYLIQRTYTWRTTYSVH